MIGQAPELLEIRVARNSRCLEFETKWINDAVPNTRSRRGT